MRANHAVQNMKNDNETLAKFVYYVDAVSFWSINPTMYKIVHLNKDAKAYTILDDGQKVVKHAYQIIEAATYYWKSHA